MQIEWTITVGTIVTSAFTLIGFIVAALGFYFALRENVRSMARDITGLTELTSERMGILAGRMVNVENKIEDMTQVLAKVAVQDERLSAQDKRMDSLSSRIKGLEDREREWPHR